MKIVYMKGDLRMEENKEELLKSTTDQIIKKFGKGSIMKMGEGSTTFDMGNETWNTNYT